MREHPALFAAGVVGVCLASLLSGAAAPEWTPVDASPIIHGGSPVKAAVDTVTLMGPGGRYPYRGDFETASAMPWGDGLLTDGWISHDLTAPANHWHVDTHDPDALMGGDRFAWCGSLAYAACPGETAPGGYGDDWYDILEFRKTVNAGCTVNITGFMAYDTETGWDFVDLLRRTANDPNFDPTPIASWDGNGTESFSETVSYLPAELLDGDISVAFVFDSDGNASDADCGWGSDGAVRLDDLVVTLTVGGTPTVYTETFEDNNLGPDWAVTRRTGVGDFARVWTGLCNDDPCGGNNTQQVAFIDFHPGLLVVPPPPLGCGMVNNTGGFLGPTYGIHNEVWSPVMPLPGGITDGLRIAFDVYQHETLMLYDSPYMFWIWSVRSTAGADIGAAPWRSRDLLYSGGPEYKRMTLDVGDLLEPDATAVQVSLGVYQYTFLWPGTNGTPAPYFDNVRVQAYPSAGPRIVIDVRRLANDGFPASGALDLVNLGNNSVRFDMAANIAPRSHSRNDPGDSIWIDVTPRSGATADPPVMHWTLARRNALFDPYRTLPTGPVTGRVTRSAAGNVVANRWNFDLPDTGMLFPGDVLHYYFSATDHRAGDARTSIAPVDLTGYGDAHSAVWPLAFTVRCLPSLADAAGTQPAMLFWNDQGSRGAEDEWLTALHLLGWREGVDVDVFNTRAPTSGAGNGLGGRATVAQVAGYTDLLYTAGDLITPTLSNGDYAADPGNDLALLNGWLALGGRDMLLCGEDLAHGLAASGTAARAFLETTMGLQYVDTDVRDDIGGQVSPVVVRAPGNPVFTTANRWLVHGGCPAPNDLDAVLPRAGTVTLANFTDPGGATTPYPHPAATLRSAGTNRIIWIPYDLSLVMDWDKQPSPAPLRAVMLDNVLSFFAVWGGGWEPSPVPGATAPLAVAAHPNPFNPAVELRYTLARPGHLAMKVFDARGALVRTLSDGPVTTASGVIVWDGADDRGGQAASGLYFVETRADGQVDVRKVTMLK